MRNVFNEGVKTRTDETARERLIDVAKIHTQTIQSVSPGRFDHSMGEHSELSSLKEVSVFLKHLQEDELPYIFVLHTTDAGDERFNNDSRTRECAINSRD